MNAVLENSEEKLSDFGFGITVDVSLESDCGVFRRYHIEKYPEITFRSRETELAGLNSFKLHGELTIRGVTKPAVLDAEYLGPIKSPWGETSIGVKAVTSINREDFGMTWNEKMENNGFVVGRDVHIVLHAEADLAEET